MREFTKWFLCFSKRMYKKYTFVIILLLIPLSVFALSFAARGESGFLRIALVNEDAGQKISDSIVSDLLGSSNLVRFSEFKSRNSAIKAMENNEIDAAWIIHDDAESRIKSFVEKPTDDNYLVTIIEREENIATRLSREKLSGAIFRHTSKQLYLNYIKTGKEFDLSDLSEEKQLSYYDEFTADGTLFSFTRMDGTDSAMSPSDSNYITTPIRGILSIIVVLCALASAMMFIQDKQKGAFSLIGNSRHIFVSLAAQLAAVLNTSLCMLISIYFLGVNVTVLREILILAFFIINTVLFSMAIQQVVGNLSVFGSLTTLLVVAMIAVCPVFFDLKKFAIIQRGFPITYYVNSVKNNEFIIYSLVYALVLSVFVFGVNKLKNLR